MFLHAQTVTGFTLFAANSQSKYHAPWTRITAKRHCSPQGLALQAPNALRKIKKYETQKCSVLFLVEHRGLARLRAGDKSDHATFPIP